MLSVAGITSMVGLLETVNHWAEEQYGIPRHRSALFAVCSIAVLSILSLKSYNTLADVGIGGMNFNAMLEYLYEILLLPIGGLMIAIFAGWAVKKEYSRDELTSLNAFAYEVWHFLIRFVVPHYRLRYPGLTRTYRTGANSRAVAIARVNQAGLPASSSSVTRRLRARSRASMDSTSRAKNRS